MKIEELEQAEIAARRALTEIEDERRQAVSAAAEAVDEQFADRMDAARRAVETAAQAVREAKSDAGSHPWEGKRVFRMKRVGSWGRNSKRVEGIVEVRRTNTQFAANARHGLPDIGEAFIRKVKKDGSPSLQFHDLWGGRIESWTLVDEEPAKA